MIPSGAVLPLAASPARNEPAPQRAEGVFHLGHRRWLDGLRGVAILLVLGCHLGWLPGGFLGVDLFFVLSGFLITSLLLEEWQSTGSIRLGQFYLRRALRLWPAFIVLLVLCGLSVPLLPSAGERESLCREIAVAACYMTNWPMLHRTDMPILGHTWSLSVEEQFYVFWPALLYAMLSLKVSRRLILSLVCCGICASALLRFSLYHWHQSHSTDRLMMLFRLYRGLDTRADALLAGCLLGLLTGWNLLPRSRLFVRWTGFASLIFLIFLCYLVRCHDYYDPRYYRGFFTVVAVMTTVALARLLTAPARWATRILESAPLVGTGRISYALYLFHQPIIHLLLTACISLSLTIGPYLARVVFILLASSFSFLAAVLSYYLIERPCLRLKDRLRPRITGGSLASGQLESSTSPNSMQAVA
ncbi:MAG TPA: acyltransferase [Gemmataceae bacterium]|jgi:peptidoglycan/LPS O-acetylase OafA/YrhL